MQAETLLRRQSLALIEDIAHFVLMYRHRRLQEVLHKQFNPDQPRDDHGRWTSGGGEGTTIEPLSNSGTRIMDTAALSPQKAGNVIFNETRSLSGPGIQDARIAVAHMLYNGQAEADLRGGKRPITANDFITDSVPPVEMQTYTNSHQAVTEALDQAAKGIDPTRGAIYMFMGGDQHVKYGKLTVSMGPFHNSFLNYKVPYKNVYINFSE